MPHCPFCKHENAAGADRCAACGAALTTIAQSRDDDGAKSHRHTGDAQSLIEDTRDLLSSGSKVEAIRLYRERTGVGLVEAKDAVEAIARGGRPPSEPRGAAPSGQFADQLEQLLRRRNFIGAIKLYRERTGKGLKESKEDVEAFARQRQIPLSQIGCGTSAAVVVVAVLIATAIAILLA